jgi:molecular chaperone GrpE
MTEKRFGRIFVILWRITYNQMKSKDMSEEKVEYTNQEEINMADEKSLPDDKSKKKSKKVIGKDKSAEKIEELENIIAQKNDQFLRLQAEFDNYRKRTLKEKMELTKTAGESILVNILPVIDDFERALKSMETATDLNPVKEGVELIFKRFSDFVKQNGVKEIDAFEKVLDTDQHEAITKIPAPTEELKGKIVDVVQKGYMLNDKVIRFAKVVIGE